jgi:hypothetical protein
LPDADLLPHFASSALKERLTGTILPYSRVLVFRYDQPGHPGIVHGFTQLSAATCRVESFPDRIIPSAPHDRTSNVLVADSQHI